MFFILKYFLKETSTNALFFFFAIFHSRKKCSTALKPFLTV